METRLLRTSAVYVELNLRELRKVKIIFARIFTKHESINDSGVVIRELTSVNFVDLRGWIKDNEWI